MKQSEEVKWIDFDYKKMGLFSGITSIILALISIALFVYIVRDPSNDISYLVILFFIVVMMTIVFSILFAASRFYVKTSILTFNDVPFDIPSHEIENILEDFIETLNMPYQKTLKELDKGTNYNIEFEMEGEGIKINVNNFKGSVLTLLSITLAFEKELSGSFEENLKMELKKILNIYLERK